MNRSLLGAAMRASVLAVALTACGGSGTGTVSITAWGEEAATVGYPNAELAFVDGWSLHFDHWITSLSAIELADPTSEAVVFADATPYLADWTQAALPVPVIDTELPEGRYKVSFAFVPAVAAATRLTTVDDALAAQMVANGWNTYVAGTAMKNGATVTFAWGMHNPVRYQYCKNGVDESDGVAVASDQTVEAGIFVHLDHVFWDRLGSENAQLRFDAIAGWKDATGAVPFDDLAGSSIAFLKDRSGAPIVDRGQPLAYDDAGLGLANLRDFILYSTSTQGHLNGEGQCTRVAL
ncbi:MAG: hypothetical protein K8W52_28635 [Deltaproteobacteria bacterium]|nr:hypothetical protein [Deltaproteobacteria bacterium]